jgi:hypothetical protein
MKHAFYKWFLHNRINDIRRLKRMAVCCNSNGIHKNGNLDKKILEFQRTSILPQELQK